MTKLGTFSIATASRAGALAACAFLLGACQSTPAEKAASVQRRAAPTAVVMGPTKGGVAEAGGLAHSPDGYPTFGAPLTAANVQMSDEEAANLQQRLSALGRQRKAGTISEAQYQAKVAEYRRLAAEHGPQTLSEIGE